MSYKLKYYTTANGKSPFKQWLNDLSNLKTQATIQIRLDRVEEGNLGNCKSVGSGVHELKIYLGPGYRVYFGKVGLEIILLLCGGDKRSQKKDIIKAQEYLKDYKIWEQKNG